MYCVVFVGYGGVYVFVVVWEVLWLFLLVDVFEFGVVFYVLGV